MRCLAYRSALFGEPTAKRLGPSVQRRPSESPTRSKGEPPNPNGEQESKTSTAERRLVEANAPNLEDAPASVGKGGGVARAPGERSKPRLPVSRAQWTP